MRGRRIVSFLTIFSHFSEHLKVQLSYFFAKSCKVCDKMGIRINVKIYLMFSVSMDFKPSISAITYYMNDLLICRVSVINSAVL